MNINRGRKLNKLWTLMACVALLMSVNAGLVQAYSSGPPNARTGAPGEGDCTGCHSSFPLNSGLGTLSVSGVNGSYEAGQMYELVVGLDDPDASRWGFEITIIGEDGMAIGTVGNLNGHTQISVTATRDYVKQTSAGTQNGVTGGVVWPVRWTAPPEGSGDATIYMAGNAANGNGSTSGDRIYTASETWTEGIVSGAPLPTAAAAVLRPNYPNPFNPRTTIAYELANPQSVRLSIYTLDGRLVKHLEDGLRAEGAHEIHWNGLDDRGMAVPSGTYFYRLQAGSVDQTRSMVLVR
jgi:hypothetical protein